MVHNYTLKDPLTLSAEIAKMRKSAGPGGVRESTIRKEQAKGDEAQGNPSYVRGMSDLPELLLQHLWSIILAFDKSLPYLVDKRQGQQQQ